MIERTLVVLKPDAVQRGIVGDLIARFEKTGLKIIGVKMFVPPKSLLDEHYPASRTEFVKGLGERTLESYAEAGIDATQHFKDVDPLKIGHEVRNWLVDFMTSAPVLAMVLEGPHAIEIVRKIRGHTLPQKANPGTITGDYSFDSSGFANTGKRPIRNLVHASGNIEEAEFEIDLWFKPKELFEYDTIHHKFMST